MRRKVFGSAALFISTPRGVEFAESAAEFAQNRRNNYSRQVVRVQRGRVVDIVVPFRDGPEGFSRTEVDNMFRATMFALAKHAYGDTSYAPECENVQGDGI